MIETWPVSASRIPPGALYLGLFLPDLELNVIKYSPTGKEVTFTNKLDIEELYDLENGFLEQLPLREFCNQIIHSFVFIIDYDDEGLTGIFVTSDRDRNSRLIYLTVDDIVNNFEIIANNYPARAIMTYNPKKKDYDITLS